MTQTPARARDTVAIVGGGWAGLACALKLAQAGYQPVVFESAPEPGGRARRALIEGHYRDNGQHLMLGGCASLRALFDAADITLPTVPFSYQSGKRQLRVPARASKFGLAWALLAARGFSWHERYCLIAALLRLQACGWRVPADQSVADWLALTRQPVALMDTFWAPLALAILNTPLHEAAMCRLAPVLRDTLGMSGSALSLFQPVGDLSVCVVSPLVKAIEKAGGTVRCSERVAAIAQTDVGFKLVFVHRGEGMPFDRIVLAMPPWALAKVTLPVTLDAEKMARTFGDQPIATVYLGFESDFRLPAPLLQIAGPTPGDARAWAIDRAHCGEPGVVAISLSAQGPWCQLPGDALAEAVLSVLRASVPNATACLWKKAVTVQRATYAAKPGTSIRPEDLQPLPHLHLAGDWTHTDYPATLEAAVYTGFAAAHRIMAQQT